MPYRESHVCRSRLWSLPRATIPWCECWHHGAPINSANSAVARGKYLVAFGSCTDCHTLASFFGKPDMTRFQGGSDVGFAIPGLGIFVGPNLTPDKQTGLANWTAEQIVTALTTGKRPKDACWRRSCLGMLMQI